MELTPSEGSRVADGIYRLGSRYLNWYVIEQEGRLTILDTGVPGYWSQLSGLLEALDLGLDAVDAVILTHHHPDHGGNARRLEEKGAAIYAHAGDRPYLVGEKRLLLLGVARFLWRPWYMGYISHLVKKGILAARSVTAVNELEDGQRLAVPGRPRVVHVPGHTPGSCALYLEDRGVLFSGDALVTLDTARGVSRPCVLTGPVTADAAMAVKSLDRLKPIDADLMLPGHGEPWTESVSAAVDAAKEHYLRPRSVWRT